MAIAASLPIVNSSFLLWTRVYSTTDHLFNAQKWARDTAKFLRDHYLVDCKAIALLTSVTLLNGSSTFGHLGKEFLHKRALATG